MASSPLIDELRVILATAFASGVASAAAEIDQNLQRLSTDTETPDKKRDCLAARSFFASHMTVLERALAIDYQQRFNEKLIGEGGSFSKTQTFSLDSLSLVEDTDVDENILIANTGKRLREDCDYDFFALGRRLEILLRVEHLQDGDNPTAPRVFCRSLLATLAAIDATPAVRVHIFNAAKAALTRILQTSYQNANEFLANQGVSIEIHKTYGKPVLSAESRIMRNDGGTAGANPDSTVRSAVNSAGATAQKPAPAKVPPDDEAPDEMDTLFSQLLARHGGSAEPAGDDGHNPALSADLARALERLSELMTPLNANEATAYRDASALPAHLLHTARTELAAQMQPAEKIVTDLVVGMFDGIFAAPELPDAIKAQLSRLQFPMLKAAMLDTSLLTDDSHPLRILIDQVADLSRRHGARLQPGDTVFERVRTLLQYLLASVAADPLAMTDVNEQLQELIEGEDDLARQLIAAAAVEQLEAEQKKRALEIATYEIERRIVSPAIPEAIRLFAMKAWRWLLMIDYLTEGDDGSDWKKDLATFDDLLWSVDPASASDARMPVLILQLVARLNEALNRAGVARTERVVFYDRLAEIHHAILDPATNSNERRLRASAELGATTALAALADPRIQTRQRSLKPARDAWVKMRVNGIDAQHCRLLWVSPLQDSYIFKNHNAGNADTATVIMSAEELDEAFKRGTLTVMDSSPLTRRSIEGAVRALLAKTAG